MAHSKTLNAKIMKKNYSISDPQKVNVLLNNITFLWL